MHALFSMWYEPCSFDASGFKDLTPEALISEDDFFV
jgi:hypothetical protein